MHQRQSYASLLPSAFWSKTLAYLKGTKLHYNYGHLNHIRIGLGIPKIEHGMDLVVVNDQTTTDREEEVEGKREPQRQNIRTTQNKRETTMVLFPARISHKKRNHLPKTEDNKANQNPGRKTGLSHIYIYICCKVQNWSKISLFIC